jgi:uncharacterized protein (TIGR02145 family)
MRNYLVIITLFLVNITQAQIMLPAYQAIQYRRNSLPVISTNAITSISTNSAVSGGTITSDGGAAVIVRGICWDINSGPTIALATKTTNGAGIGTFNSILSSLAPSTTYFVRAYATNNVGTVYGNEVIFTTSCATFSTVQDIDGNVYNTVLINNIEWMQRNLEVEHYRNGDIIPQVTDPTQWSNLTTGAWCYGNNDPAYGSIYGKLYNYYAVTDPRGLAPVGWHVSSELDWSNTTNFLGGISVAAGKMKDIGGLHWYSYGPYPLATNSSCWSAYGGGRRELNGAWTPSGWSLYPFNGSQSQIFGFWWTTNFSQYQMNFNLDNAFYTLWQITNPEYKRIGQSVRCVKD